MHTLALLIALAADPAPADSVTARAEAVVLALGRTKYDTAAVDFTPEMQKALPPDKLKTVWESVLDKYGPFQKVLSTRTESRKSFEIAFVTCQFEKDKLDIRLVYSAEKKLGGMQFVPPKPAVEYKSPPYVHAERFKARDVTVGGRHAVAVARHAEHADRRRPVRGRGADSRFRSERPRRVDRPEQAAPRFGRRLGEPRHRRAAL